MKRRKVFMLTVAMSMYIFSALPVLAEGGISPFAASRWCSHCGTMTPFADCIQCKFDYPNTPYHCDICGRNFGGGICIGYTG